MEVQISTRANNVKPSPTFAVAMRAKALKAEGHDIIGLGVGEPDFDTPEPIKQAAIKAINEGFTKYTPVDGIPELKDAIIHKFKHDNGFDYTPKQILVSVGAKQSLYNLFQALLNAGDEVLIVTPYWVSYPEMARLAGATPVIVETDITKDFKLSPENLEKQINSNTKLLVLNSPSNPSGKIYSKEELAALGEVLKKHPQIVIASDDIYEHIIWPGQTFCNIVNACPELFDRTVVINGVSKAYSMTGWRIGYAGGPAHLIAAMKKVQSQSTSGANSIAQKAAVEALTMDQTCVQEMVKAFKERHDFVYEALNNLPGFECLPSDGTFYSFPKVTEAMAKIGIKDDVEFAEHLLNEAGVALVPGSAFGMPGQLRLSYAASKETLADAIERIGKVL